MAASPVVVDPEPASEPRLRFADQAEWAVWLEGNADRSSGVWLQVAKTSTTRTDAQRSVTYDEALEVALCHGWIDGQKRPLDDSWWLQRFTARRPRSRWSKRNRDLAERLIAEGRMLPAGQAEVERARADGRWAAAYAGAATMTVPADLQAALDAEPALAEAFAALDGTNRYAILYRLQDAKKPETRGRRLSGFLDLLRQGQTLHPQRKRS